MYIVMQFKNPFSPEMKRQLSRPAIQDKIFQCNIDSYSEEVKNTICKIRVQLTKLNETIYNMNLIKSSIKSTEKDEFLRVKSNLLLLRSNLHRQIIRLMKLK